MNLQHLIESLGWDSFLPANAEPPQRIRTIRNLLGEFSAQQLCEQGEIVNRAQAAKFKARIRLIAETMGKLQRHVVRSKHRYLHALVTESNKRLDQFLRNPSHSSYCILESFYRYIDETFAELQGGTYNDTATHLFLEGMMEARIPGNISAIIHLYETKEADRHKKFVTALERQFGITVKHFEPVAEGVYVYLNGEATDTLWEQLKSVPDILNNIADKHGYLTLRRGSRADIEWGSFPESYSTWTFVYCPASDGEIGDCEVISKHDYKPVNFLGGKSQNPLA